MKRLLYCLKSIALIVIIVLTTSCNKGKQIIIGNSNKFQGIVFVDSGTNEYEIQLPEFDKFCHFAADSNDFRWIGASNRMFPWNGGKNLTELYKNREPVPPRIPAPNKRSVFMIFQLTNGQYLSLLPLATDKTVSWLEVKRDGKLFLGYGTLGSEQVHQNNLPVVSWCIADNIYKSVYNTWNEALLLTSANGKIKLRSQRDLLEPMRYLGWCTWEQYHSGINEKILTDAISTIENSEVPVRWFLIDDGHQDDNGKGMLKSMFPNKKKFPNGWEPITSRKKEDKIKWMGIWHGFLSHWNGISKDHNMPEIQSFLMKHPSRKSGYLPGDTKEQSEAFYDYLIRNIKKQGFDFMKTDNVSRSTLEYLGSSNPVSAERFNILALERACHENNIGLMNCSAQNTICLLNTSHSSTMRTSPDYQKHNLSTSKSQILQSVANVLWLGQTLWPDHDMFHSSDKEVGRTMSVTKSMSGGPVYLSDAPKDFESSVIMPMCYKDGLLVRPLAPGVPCPESIFNDALYEKENLYKVIAPLNNNSCAIAMYNLSVYENQKLNGVINSDDYKYTSAMIQPFNNLKDIPKEGLIVYDWDQQKVFKLNNTNLNVSIQGFGHRLFILTPIENGWSMIGRTDKYLSPSTVEIEKNTQDSLSFKMYEPSEIIFYSTIADFKSDSMDFVALGDGFYKGIPHKNIQRNDLIEIAREM